MKLNRKINIGLICLGIAIVLALVYVIAACSINEKDRRDLDGLLKQFETDLVKWELGANIGDTPEQLLADADRALGKYSTANADSTAAGDSIHITNETWKSVEKEDASSTDVSIQSFKKATGSLTLMSGRESYTYDTIATYSFTFVKVNGEWKIDSWETGYNYSFPGWLK